MANFARSAYDLAFQISPIIMTGGSASGLLGAALPVLALLGDLAGLIQGGSVDDLPRYTVMAGGTLINNAVGMYPFANQQVAANAIIEQPLNISLHMKAPVNTKGGYLTKLAIFTAMRTAFRAHNNSGGTYAVATPAFIYTNCLMTSMTDISGANGQQQQIEWQIDFVKPLISQQQAQQAYSGLMGKIAGGQEISGAPAWSGPAAATGAQAPGAVAGTTGATQLSGVVSGSSLAPSNGGIVGSTIPRAGYPQ